MAQLATKTGTDAEHLVKDAALRVLKEEAHIPAAAPELPVLHLGDDLTPPPRHLR